MVLMNVLSITFLRGKSFFRSCDVLSVFIDGDLTGKISDREQLSVELSDGFHEIILRCGHCKKIVDLHMHGDDSFTVSWDCIAGGLMVFEGTDGVPVPGRRGYCWFYIAMFTIIGIHTVNAGLYYGGYNPYRQFLEVNIVCLACFTFIILPVALIRSRKVVRVSGIQD